MSTLSTHVLDVSRGRPAANLPVLLEAQEAGAWRQLAKGLTNEDGRVKDFLPAGTQLRPGVYRLTFDTAAYFDSRNERGFYPHVNITFEISNPGEHYHVPLLLSPYGFSTYRGS